MKPQEVLKFWFEECKPEQWFRKDSKFDQMICDRFFNVHQQARKGELWDWRKDLDGRLAEIIVLDQFSRNMFRDHPEMFAQDALALILAQEAIALTEHRDLPAARKPFLYMPFMHSESLAMHAKAVELFSQPGLENNLDFEYKHKAIIERFGRFPHRNELLGRKSRPEEIEFLKQPGSSF